MDSVAQSEPIQPICKGTKKRNRDEATDRKCANCSSRDLAEDKSCCEPCLEKHRIHVQNYHEQERGAFSQILADMKRHSRTLHKDDTVDYKFPGKCETTLEVLIDIYIRQNRRCNISGLPLTHLPGSDFQTSANRIDDGDDYDDNTEIVAYEFNTPVHWSTEQLDEIPGLRTMTIEPRDHKKMMLSLEPAPRAKPHKPESRIIGGICKKWCFKCNKWKPLVEMRNGTECKTCHNDRTRASIYKELKRLLNSAISSTKQRHQTSKEAERKQPKKQKKNTHGSQEATDPASMEMTFEFLCEMLKTQDFRCAYSGIPLQFPCMGPAKGCYRMSLERKNPWIGYTKENVCLIARCFQSGDQTRKHKHDVTGSCAWSKCKFDYVMQWRREHHLGLAQPSQTYAQFKAQYQANH